MLVAGAAAEAASPRKSVKEGNLYYQQEDYAASRDKYEEALEKDPESDIVNFNLGTALYKEKDYHIQIQVNQRLNLGMVVVLMENCI